MVRKTLSDISGFDEKQIEGYADIQNITKGNPVEEVLRTLRGNLRKQDKAVSNKKAVIDSAEEELSKIVSESVADKESLLKDKAIIDEKEAKIADLSKAYETTQSELESLKKERNDFERASGEQLEKKHSEAEVKALYQRYFDLPDEYEATMWAIEYIRKNSEKVTTLWKKLQKAIIKFYKINRIEVDIIGC